MLNRTLSAALIAVCVIQPAWASSSESPESVIEYHRRSRDLSAGAQQLAEIAGLGDQLTAMKASQGTASNAEALVHRLAARQNLLEDVLAQSFEVRSMLAELEQEIAEADDLQAYLEHRRDRSIRLNTIANFISGGITGIIGGGLDIAAVTKTASASIDLGEGVVQTSLALFALKQQAGEKRLMEGLPNKLAKVLDLAPNVDFPSTIWKYLNSIPPNQNKTRRQILVEHWSKSGMIAKARFKGDTSGDLSHLAGTRQRVTISIDLLDARSAMLADLKAVVREMDVYLLEILQILRRAR